MAEAVDRLELVADDDQLGCRAAQRLDQPQLQAVGVLELVDHQVAEAGAVGVADLGPLEQPRRRGAGGPRSRAPRGAPWPPRSAPRRGSAARRGGGRRAPPSPASATRGDRRVDRLAVGGHRLRLAVGAQRRQLVEVRGGAGAREQLQRPLDQLAAGAVGLQLGRGASAAPRPRAASAPARSAGGRLGQARARRRRGCAARRGRR